MCYRSCICSVPHLQQLAVKPNIYDDRREGFYKKTGESTDLDRNFSIRRRLVK
ncbi:hypothetical protein DAI22_02g157200 [Oryza sativa Japonica Group]|nr:hypothetical protein DAI22_02g157200 [Oryza sativa Japonica Group]